MKKKINQNQESLWIAKHAIYVKKHMHWKNVFDFYRSKSKTGENLQVKMKFVKSVWKKKQNIQDSNAQAVIAHNAVNFTISSGHAHKKEEEKFSKIERIWLTHNHYYMRNLK